MNDEPEKKCFTCFWWKILEKRCGCVTAEKNGEITDYMWSCDEWVIDETTKKIYECL